MSETKKPKLSPEEYIKQIKDFMDDLAEKYDCNYPAATLIESDGDVFFSHRFPQDRDLIVFLRVAATQAEEGLEEIQ